ncbi:deoxycytidine triphosphate deaminase [Candidatus Phycosocius bacilliformis]|uniref:Deoxycytidine triphosphate deaminase n=1 Tax=Candidatus Phycosocius bacilliformis TaxID=1445552 RepID=A0A2P2ECF0_9PROT|nr:2'-deoxycytidine 5'-triphosphate deaminase [Candidatus Phycosocius bacilliformis]GBF58748.1 deoxycytidine triphosphate deaminase [Candidatus Phycosocius bacilliformis]
MIDSIADGVLPDHILQALADQGAISATHALADRQIQPASLDLRLGDYAYRIRASFLPGQGRSVAERLDESDLVLHRLDLREGAVLETGCVYLAPLQESLALPLGVRALANPKSSTGRIDVFVRVIADGATSFDRVREGYQGPLWVEICPRTFSILARPGDRLAQLRLKKGETPTLNRLDLNLDLSHASLGSVIGYRARRHAPLLDLAKVGGHAPHDWFEPLTARDGRLVLDPGEFYILASQPGLSIPRNVAAEMVATAEDLGEFRAHYAGFFDPGFGVDGAGGPGARGVLEVRGRDVPFVLEHDQPVARLVYEPLAAAPAAFYGDVGSHYQGQGLKLSKLFQPWS